MGQRHAVKTLPKPFCAVSRIVRRVGSALRIVHERHPPGGIQHGLRAAGQMFLHRGKDIRPGQRVIRAQEEDPFPELVLPAVNGLVPGVIDAGVPAADGQDLRQAVTVPLHDVQGGIGGRAVLHDPVEIAAGLSGQRVQQTGQRGGGVPGGRDDGETGRCGHGHAR